MVDLPRDIEDYGFHLEKENENTETTVGNNLSVLKEQSKRMIESYERYCQSTDERLKDDLSYAINSRLNHFSQAFKDIMAYIEINKNGFVKNESLGYYKRTFLSLNLGITKNAECALDYLSKRNDLVHDYFNTAQLNQTMLKGIATYGDGFTEIADLIEKKSIIFPELIRMRG